MNIKKIGYNIMDDMAVARISFSELSRRMGCARSTITNRVHNPERMKLGDFCRIAQELGKTPAELLEGVWTDS